MTSTIIIIAPMDSSSVVVCAKFLDGTTLTLRFSPDELLTITGLDCKIKIHQASMTQGGETIEPDMMRIIYNGSEVGDDTKLCDDADSDDDAYILLNGTTLFVVRDFPDGSGVALTKCANRSANE